MWCFPSSLRESKASLDWSFSASSGPEDENIAHENVPMFETNAQEWDLLSGMTSSDTLVTSSNGLQPSDGQQPSSFLLLVASSCR